MLGRTLTRSSFRLLKNNNSKHFSTFQMLGVPQRTLIKQTYLSTQTPPIMKQQQRTNTTKSKMNIKEIFQKGNGN